MSLLRLGKCSVSVLALILTLASSYSAAGKSDGTVAANAADSASLTYYRLYVKFWDGEKEVASPAFAGKYGSSVRYQTKGKGEGRYRLEILVSEDDPESREDLVSVSIDAYAVTAVGPDWKLEKLASPFFVIQRTDTPGDPVYFSLNDRFDISFTLEDVTASEIRN